MFRDPIFGLALASLAKIPIFNIFSIFTWKTRWTSAAKIAILIFASGAVLTGKIAANVQINLAVLATPVLDAVALEGLLAGAVEAALSRLALVAVDAAPARATPESKTVTPLTSVD